MDAAGNMYLDDGSVDSPHFRLIDEGNQYLDVFKEETGVAYFLNTESGLALQMNNDTDDYLYFQTVSDVPGITTVGGCNLSITCAGDTIDFGAENLTTTGGLTCGSLVWSGASFSGESPLVFEGATTNAFQLYFQITDPADHDKVQTFQNESGIVALNSTAVTELGGNHLTVTNKTLDVDDAFLHNDGDAGTGTYDFTAAVFAGESAIVFDGATTNAFQLYFQITDPADHDKVQTFQNESGIVALNSTAVTELGGNHLTVTNKTLDVDDAFLHNDGDAGTGTYDFTAAVFAGESAIVFDGATAGTNKTTLRFTDPTGMRSIAFPDATGMVPVSVTTPVTLSATGDIGLTVAKDIVAGVGLSGGADDVLPGADADVTLTFAPDEVTGGTTWDDGGEASVVWTWNLAAGDPAITFGADSITTGASFAFESALAITLGKDDATNTAGSAKWWSEGANDYSFSITAPIMLETVSLTWPPETGADGYMLARSGAAALSWTDPTLLYVTSRGASTATTVELQGETALVLGLDDVGRDNKAGRVNLISAGDNAFVTAIIAGTNTQNNTYTLPPDDGDAGEQLQTDGAGNLTWEAAGGHTQNTDTGTTSTTFTVRSGAGAAALVIMSNGSYGVQLDGLGNSASGQIASCLGGAYNIAGGTCSATIGGNSASTPLYGQVGFASGKFATGGDAQCSHLVMRRLIETDVPRELYLDGAVMQAIIPTETTWFARIFLGARQTDGSSGWAEYQYSVERTAASTTIVDSAVAVGTPYWHANIGAPTIAIGRDDSTDAGIVITITQANTTSTRWVARVDLLEIGY
jgi:hypothetical protein